jgi:hypothetical protein
MTLLDDATVAIHAHQMRQAILGLAMACEVALKSFVHEYGGSKDKLYTYVVEKDRELSIFDYLNDVMRCLTGRPIKDVLAAKGKIDAYRKLENLFKARNKVAHEGRGYLAESNGKNRLERDINWILVRKIETAARELIEYL